MATWVAQDAGIFKKHGLSVDLRLINSAPGMAALLAGETQMAAIGGLEVVNAAAGGANLVVLATLTPVYSFAFEVPASIKTASDLRGKKIGVSKFGSSTDAAARAALQRVGLNPDKDVTILQIGGLGAVEAALANGAVQGAPDQFPNVYILEHNGFHTLVDLAKLKLPFATAVLAAKRSWVTAHEQETQTVVDSLVEAIAREKQDRPLTINVLKKHLKVDSEQALQATYNYYVGELQPGLPIPRRDQFTEALQIVGAKNPAATHFDVSKIIDSAFVQKARKEEHHL